MNFFEILLLIGKTTFSYFFLLIILKIMGKRELSQVSIFDVVIFLIMSELFSLALNNPKSSLLHFIIPVGVIVILELLSAVLSLRFTKVRRFLEGKSQYIIFKGKIDYQAMKKNRYNINDLMLQLRNKDIQTPLEVEYAILEGNGNLNIIKKENLLVEYPEPLIIDGKINLPGLEKINKDENYLLAILSNAGYDNPQKIFFAQLLKDGLYVIPFEETSD